MKSEKNKLFSMILVFCLTLFLISFTSGGFYLPDFNMVSLANNRPPRSVCSETVNQRNYGSTPPVSSIETHGQDSGRDIEGGGVLEV
ncbi:hypothetical protein RJD24_15955 [Bacillaceae bacterium IKA-2]|nr:hypothetical protein RJD24_15955 [Bacillaceae bacterium IKA-2]